MADEFGIHITFAPEHMCTETLMRHGRFLHDYDRIISRNEKTSLVSHDCHFYLRVQLATVIPPRKAMVMTGENVAIDVDEGVYAGGWS